MPLWSTYFIRPYKLISWHIIAKAYFLTWKFSLLPSKQSRSDNLIFVGVRTWGKEVGVYRYQFECVTGQKIPVQNTLATATAAKSCRDCDAFWHWLVSAGWNPSQCHLHSSNTFQHDMVLGIMWHFFHQSLWCTVAHSGHVSHRAPSFCVLENFCI